MTTYLLDVNVLLALSDPMHLHHDAAHRWFEARGKEGWATCPITENGFVRIASHPSYPNRPGDTPAVLSLLRQMCAVEGHQFWPDSVTICSLLGPTAVLTHPHVTDAYLLGLAIAHQGKLATFDQRITSLSVQGGDTALELLSV